MLGVVFLKGLFLSPGESVQANEYIHSLALNMPDVDVSELVREIGLYKSKEGILYL